MKLPFDIVINPTGSKFAKGLQKALNEKISNKVFRRATPKVVPPKRAIISRKGNVLRRAQAGYTRHHFAITQNPLNKIEQLTRFKAAGVSCPAFTTDANNLASLGTKTVFARTLVNSTNGRGIVELELREGVAPPRAPLYTAYIPKKAEYRIHVFEGKVIDRQQKKKKLGFENERNTRIRNVNNGYVYTRENITLPDGVDTLAIGAVAACGYKYGAVDIIYNEKQNQSYVLEVNSRPGLMGTTLDNYANAIILANNLEKK